MDNRQWILWDWYKDGEPPRSEDGEFNTGGLMGALDVGNVYLNTYAVYASKRHTDLEVGQWCLAKFNLSGTKGEYRVYRVR